MKVIAHCFSGKASIKPNSVEFEFEDFQAKVIGVDNKLMLRIEKTLN